MINIALIKHIPETEILITTKDGKDVKRIGSATFERKSKEGLAYKLIVTGTPSELEDFLKEKGVIGTGSNIGIEIKNSDQTTLG